MHRLFASILIVTASGCADGGDESFIIRNNLTPEDPASCSISADLQAPFISRGIINSSSPNAYVLTPLIESRITAAEGKESQRTVSLMGAKVDLLIGPVSVEDSGGNVTFSCALEGPNACFSEAEMAALNTEGTTKFRSLFSAPLPPNGGLSSATFDIVPTTVLAEIRSLVGAVPATSRLRAQVIATTTVFGDLYTTEVSGQPYTYPVTVCNDCVANVLGTCPLPMGTELRTGNPCNAFQDGVIDCCLEGTQLRCPAIVATTAN